MVNPNQDRDLTIRTGVDLVKLAEFSRSLERGGETFLRRIFQPSEAAGASLERLAGVFAAKEAAFKALNLPKGDWHILEISHDAEGRPAIILSPSVDTEGLLNCDVSISHTDDYALASVVSLWRKTGA